MNVAAAPPGILEPPLSSVDVNDPIHEQSITQEQTANSPNVIPQRIDSSLLDQSSISTTPPAPNSEAAQQHPTNPPIPSPRRSSRTNRGVPPLRLHDYVHGRD